VRSYGEAFGSSAETQMTVNLIAIQPLVALLFGILILAMPRLLNFLVAIYLILIGVVGLWPHVVTTHAALLTAHV
jgi:hypothetical protein